MHYAAPRVQRAEVLRHARIAASTYKITLAAPEIASEMVPGQFVMLRLADRHDAILGRAFAMWDRVDTPAGGAEAVEFVYVAKGRMTRALADAEAGGAVDLWGPLGNGFSTAAADHLILVAGGVGQTPMLTLAAEALGTRRFGSPPRTSGYASRVTICYGARTAAYLAGIPEFEASGADLRITTDDGSAGRPGRVTDSLEELLANRDGESVRICCCGPEPMMEAVAAIAARHRIACEVSLETPMACGIGICFTCVAKLRQADGSWDYRRTCVEGPVFDAAEIVWE